MKCHFSFHPSFYTSHHEVLYTLTKQGSSRFQVLKETLFNREILRGTTGEPFDAPDLNAVLQFLRLFNEMCTYLSIRRLKTVKLNAILPKSKSDLKGHT